MSFDTDAGIISWTDLPISTTTENIVNSYSASIANIDLLTIYGVTNGSRTLTRSAVGIASSTPWGTLSVEMGSTSPAFVVSDEGTSTPAFIVGGNGFVGLGTSTPGTLFSVQGIANFSTATSTFLSTGGINVTSGCVAIRGVCLGSGSGAGTVNSGTINQLAYYTGSTAVSSSGFLSINNTSGFLGIGTSTPGSQVAIGGNAIGNTLLELDALTGQTAPILNVRLASTTKFIVSSTGNVGIGTSTPDAILTIQSVGKFVANATSSIWNGLAVSGLTATSSGIIVTGGSILSNGRIELTGTATSSFTSSGLSVAGGGLASSAGLTITGGRIKSSGELEITSVATSTFLGSIGVGTTTPLARLSIDGSTNTTLGIAGIHEIVTINPTAGGAIQYGNRFIIQNMPTNGANTMTGQLIRVIDSSGNSNTVLGQEIQAGSGTTTAGVNTGLRANGKTFGVQGLTTSSAAGTLVPAGLYAETTGTTQGQALRAYSASITTADMGMFYEEGTQTFSGTGLKMNFNAAGGGAFTGNFINFQVQGASMLIASSSGTLAIGSTTPYLGANIPSSHRSLIIDSGAMGTGTSTPLLYLSTSDASAGNKMFISAFSDSGANPRFIVQTTGKIVTDDTAVTGPADVAEYISAKNDKPYLEPGDLLVIDGSDLHNLAKKSTGIPYDSKVIGVVSTKPGFVAGGGSVEQNHDDDVIGALIGRVPVKVSDENGEVKVGDRLTSSSIPGVAMKATSSGMTIGMALEGFDGVNAYSQGTLDVLAQKESVESTATVTETKTIDNRNYSGEANPAKDGTVKEVTVSRQATTTTEIFVKPENAPATASTTSSGKMVKIGKVLVFLNLTHITLDSGLSGLTSTSTDNAWTIGQQSGKVTVNYSADLNLQGNNIYDVGAISGMSGKWRIDENGKLTAKEIEVEKATVTKELNVGTADKPTGITIYDEVTGSPYCIKMSNGAMVTSVGTCVSAPPSESPAPEPSPTPTIIEEPPQSGDDATAGQATPTPEPTPPEPTPTPTPEPTIIEEPPQSGDDATAGQATPTL